MTTKRAYKLQEFVAHASNVNCLKIGRRTSRVLVTGGEDHKVNIWAIGKPNAILSLSGHTSAVESVSFDSSEILVAAGAASGTVKLWDLEEAKIIRTLTGHRSNCISVDFHPFGEFVASASLDTNLKIWDIRKKGCIQTYKGHTRGVNSIRFTPDGRWVVSGGEDNIVKLWDLTAGKLLHDFKCHEGQIQCIDFHPHEFLLATGSADKTVKFWDLETFELIGSTGPETSGIRSVTFNPDGRTLLCGLHESLKVYSWEPVRFHDSVDVGWSKLLDMNVHEGKLLGCSYNQSCVGVWVVDISRLEPYTVASNPKSNGHSESKSSSSNNLSFQIDNNLKASVGKLSNSQICDPLAKESKSLSSTGTALGTQRNAVNAGTRNASINSTVNTASTINGINHKRSLSKGNGSIYKHDVVPVIVPKVSTRLEPVTEFRKDVGAERRESVDEFRNEVTQRKESVDEFKNEVTQRKESFAESRKEVAERKDTSTESRKEVAERKEPVTESRKEVVSERKEPATESRKEVVSERKEPAAESRKEVVSERKEPAAESRKDVFERKEPAAESRKEAVERKESITESRKETVAERTIACNIQSKPTDFRRPSSRDSSDRSNFPIAERKDSIIESRKEIVAERNIACNILSKPTDSRRPSSRDTSDRSNFHIQSGFIGNKSSVDIADQDLFNAVNGVNQPTANNFRSIDAVRNITGKFRGANLSMETCTSYQHDSYDIRVHKSRDPRSFEMSRGRTRTFVQGWEKRDGFTRIDGPTPSDSSDSFPSGINRPWALRGRFLTVGNETTSSSDDDAIGDLLNQHEQFIDTAQSRLRKLQVVHQLWTRKDVKGLISALGKMSDHAVSSDVVNILMEKCDLITLDLCTFLLPLLSNLLDSRMDRHLCISLEMLLKLAKSFGPLIKSTLSAGSSVGVDLQAEQRLERCNLCFIEFEKIKHTLFSLTRRGGSIAKSAQELNLTLQEVMSYNTN